MTPLITITTKIKGPTLYILTQKIMYLHAYLGDWFPNTCRSVLPYNIRKIMNKFVLCQVMTKQTIQSNS